MKNFNRILSFVLCLVMVLGMFPGIVPTAKAEEGETYTYELVTSIEAGGKYVIVGAGNHVALMNNNGSFGSQTVTISGTELTSTTELTEWTISGTSGATIKNGSQQLSYTSSAWSLSGSGNNTFDIAAGSASNFSIRLVRSSGNRYYFYYDGSKWTDKNSNAQYVRLYKKVEATVVSSVLLHNEGSVHVGAKATAHTGAYIRLTMSNGTVKEVPVTVGMLSQNDAAVSTETQTGEEGLTGLTVTYNGTVFSNNFTLHITPKYGTDYPEYPNEGAIRIDKTAEAVGTFSETGVAKVELSMTGVPFTTDNTLDVVLMLDRSSSMYKQGVQHRISSTVEATKAFIRNLVINSDGSFNGNRILVLDFLGGNVAQGSRHQFQSNRYTNNDEDGYQIIDDQAELDALLAKIEDEFVGQTGLYGTEYAQGLELCDEALAASRADGNQQFCVFMSDGIPNYMKGETTNFTSTSSIVGRFSGTSNSNTPNMSRGTKYEYEYYSTKMKNAGVTVYTVGLGLKNTNSAWSGATAAACEQVANMLLNDIAGPAYEKTSDRDTGNTVSKLGEYFFSVADDNAAADMENVFTNIAGKILQAATDVVVTDKVADEYTMIFGIPQSSGTTDEHEQDNAAVQAALADREFYIEFLEYALDDDHERIIPATSKLKLYLGVNTVSGKKTYYAATAFGATNNANKFANPTFTAKPADAEGRWYWSVVADGTVADEGEIIVSDGTKSYIFKPNGDGDYNMTAGAYAFGNIDSATNMSEDLVIVTPYFAYCAASRMLAWTVDKLTTVEYALSYFLYLDHSACDVGTDNETDEGPYPTNDYAYIDYTNFNGTRCHKEFPKPQLTWNGAQVSYVFYLVNKQGQPINKSGQVVDFANATFVTDVFTEHVIWNDSEENAQGTAFLDADYRASELLPGAYTLYDESARYILMVYEDHEGNTLDNYFTISGGETLAAGAASTTKVYNTKAGTKYAAYGKYNKENVAGSFDFANTTVAFAVVWSPALVEDVVVVDFGLDVLIDVTRNDFMDNQITGISATRGKVTMNTGVSTTKTFTGTEIDHANYTASIESTSSIRFSQDNMIFTAPVTFYYESPVSYYESSAAKSGFMYSSVTVVPATTIYYEDDFVDFSSYTWDYEKNEWTSSNSLWTQEGATGNATQAQDRPGKSQISANLDADNIYGYDGAYSTNSTFSNGSAMVATVDYDNYAAATFKFWGTGFDVISLTSNTTGTILVDVVGENYNGNFLVDTFYGYKLAGYGKYTYTYRVHSSGLAQWELSDEYEVVTELLPDEPRPAEPKNGDTYHIYKAIWISEANIADSLYQVPVMKVEDLPYGEYTVTIKATYDPMFGHGQKDGESYDFYLDAIRIYDPTGNRNEQANEYYEKDHEAYAKYFELRNHIIDTAKANTIEGMPSGAVYIDGVGTTSAFVTDYLKYGPNNEVYLSVGQAVAFAFDQNAILAALAEDDGAAPNGYEIDKIHLGVKLVTGTSASVKVFNAATTNPDNVRSNVLKTATDMYYDITSLLGAEPLVITNIGQNGGIVSITDIKVTYKKTATTANAQSVSDGSIFCISREAIDLALAALNNADESEIPVEPETFRPETLTVKVNKSTAKEGQKVKVTVNTGNDVAYLLVNGEKVTDYKTVKGSVVRSWTFDVIAQGEGEMEIVVVACNAEGVESKAVVTVIDVKPAKTGMGIIH